MTGAIIGAIATVVGAVLAALVLRSDALDRLKSRGHTSIVGRWDSVWVDEHDRTKREQREDVYVTRQKGTFVAGHILNDRHPDKRWVFEGRFARDFLQLLYQPSSDSFKDFGAYFFQMQGNGDFVGYSVGFDWESGSVGVSKHRLVKHGKTP